MAPGFLTLTGYLKIATIILGFTTYGLAVYSYDETIVQEEYFLRSVQISALISVIIFAVQIASDKFASSEISKAVDVVWHMVGAVAILLGAGLVLYSAIDNERSYCHVLRITYPEHFCQFFAVKLTAGIFAVLNGILYAVIATVAFLEITNARRGNGNRGQVHNNVHKRWSTGHPPTAPRLSTLPKCTYYYGQAQRY